MMPQHTVLTAEVVRVTDGDTIRVRHTPLVDLWGTGQTGTGKNGRQKLTEETMLIRLAGVDAPETKKPGSPGQPFSEEAKEFVKERLLNRKGNARLDGINLENGEIGFS
jgi:micrococcal nuclease